MTEAGVKYWICPEKGCKKAYTRPSKLKVHLLAHRGVRPFRCDVPGCSWAFVTNSKLQRHRESHRKEGRPTFACRREGCRSKFSTVYNLHKHEKLHKSEPRFACAVCGARAFPTEKMFAGHARAARCAGRRCRGC